MAPRPWVPRRAVPRRPGGRWRLPALLPRGGASAAGPDGRALARAARTAAAVRLGGGWVWPYWLERQLDPASPAFVPLGDLGLIANVTRRNWTRLGNPSSPSAAVVDERGLVTPAPAAWSLDWWIGAEDRWHLPSREAAVRQRLVDGAPVVETAMRVPGGDVVHRAYAARMSGGGADGAGEGAGDLVVVEVENRTSTPVALALAVRPADLAGSAPVERIAMDGDRAVVVDARVALLLPRPPAGAAASTLEEGDVADVVVGGEAGPGLPSEVRCPAGLATAAVVFPLAHRATLRVAVPVEPGPLRRRRGVAPRRAALPAAVPAGEQVARGWQAHAARGLRLTLPDGPLTEAVEANRRALLLLHGDLAAGTGSRRRPWSADDTAVLGALDRYGFHDEAAQVLASFPERQRADGSFSDDGWAAHGAALHALAEHWRLSRHRAVVDDMEAGIARAVQGVERARRRSREDDPELRGLLAAARADAPAGYRDDFWGVAGMRAGAELLSALGEERGAADAAAMAEGFMADVEASLAHAARRLGTPAIPAGPRGRVDHAAARSLVACWPLRLLPAADERVAATAGAVRDRGTAGDAVVGGAGGAGLGVDLTLLLAFVELDGGDRRALDRLRWLLDVASATWTWPELVHPRLGGGCAGDGHHAPAAAGVVSFVRNLLVRETTEGLALCSLLPDGWEGQGVEVHGAPTAAGRLSYALRWHGERPALLWELEPHTGVGPTVLTAPGLDPGWSSSDPAGEALLAPYAPAGAPPAAEEHPPPAPAPLPSPSRRPGGERAAPPPDAGTFG